MTLAQHLGSFAATLRVQDLPPQVVADLKLRVLDLFGAAVSGVEAGGWIAFDREQAPGKAWIWATGNRGAARDAAFLNSFVAHATYMEDGSRFSGGHPSSVVIPAVLATAEDTGHGDGSSLITALAVGYEVFLRLGRAIYPEVVRRGHQSTAALGAVAAAAAVANARRLSPEQAAHAIAMAANLGFGLKHALKASGSQPVQVARACEGGVIAAEAALRGATGAPDILEAALLPMLGGACELGAVTQDLGYRFSVRETYLKLHGGCRGNHAPIDLVQDLVTGAGRALAEVSQISVWVDSVTHDADIDSPQTPEQAQFSARFAVAAHLLTGDALPDRYTALRLADPAQRALMARITVGAETALDVGYPDRRGARAQIVFVDGKVVEGEIANARGEPEAPVSADGVAAKFQRLAGSALGTDATRLLDLTASLDHLSDTGVIGALMAGVAGNSGLRSTKHQRILA